VSSGVDLRVNRSLDLLQSLKKTASAFAKREDQLSRDFKNRHQIVDRHYRDSVAAAESKCSSQVAAVENLVRGEKERIKSIYESRRARVQRFYIAGIRNLPRHAHEAKERWIGDLQMRKYHEEKKLRSEMAAAGSSYGSLSSRLEVSRATFGSIEGETRKCFRGYQTLRNLLRAKKRASAPAEVNLDDQFEDLDKQLKTAGEELDQFARFRLPRFFRYAPLPALLVVVFGLGAVFLWYFGLKSTAGPGGAAACFLLGIAFWIVHHQGLVQSRATGVALALTLGKARQLLEACSAFVPVMGTNREQAHRRIEEAHAAAMDEIQQQWSRAGEIEADYIAVNRRKFEAQVPRIFQKIDRLLSARTLRLEAELAGQEDWLNNEAVVLKQQAAASHESEANTLAAEEQVSWDTLESDWRNEITPVYQAIDLMNAEASTLFPAWCASVVEAWTPPPGFTSATKFGRLEMDVARQPGLLPKSPRLALPGPANVSVSVALSFPAQGSLLFETKEPGRSAVVATLNNIILRLLATTPPGKLSFTIIDPVGLGQSFAGLMYLADYQESLINRHIWTQRDQIEERLAELSQHIEKVIQMYLRNEYETITDYNAQAGSVAEKYHFLVIADFPANFSETAAKRLQSIAVSGARCGVFTLIHWDQRRPLPEGFVADDLRANSVCIQRVGNGYVIGNQQVELGASLLLDPPPETNLTIDLVHKIGKSSIDSNRVEVPFVQIAPKPEEMWTGDTTKELRIAVGRTGATKFQYLAMGRGTLQHALFAGKTGSGKSTLFHVIITNLALTCSPEQVEFYLIDFKKGVEFKCYATKHLPHARVVAIESDREFALSVLQRVDGELRRRGDMFRKLGVQDLPGYKRAGGSEPMPRCLLVIDEFQEFFVEDDATAQTASLLFDRIVRQGRAFGIHVLLGSQTLGGAYSLARATLGQMAIRVALQCNEADSYLIMDENNPAPRLLSRPGEGIYNDAAGAIEGNSPFQVVWLPDDERDQWLDKVRALADKRTDRVYPNPIVFEGNAPADIQENSLLEVILESAPALPPVAARCWLGAPNSIKGPTEIVFQRQSGNHLLIVGQRGETELFLLGLSMLALAAQYPKGTAKFILFQSTTPGSPEADFIDQIVRMITHEVVAVHGSNVAPEINDLGTELKRRTDNEAMTESAQRIFLCIHGLQKFKQLRHEDDFSFAPSGPETGPDPGAEFAKIITEGSSHGIHILVTVDTLNSINHFMNRKALSEFEMRIVFQMSANDSSSLIDSAQASNLGLHRALYYNEHEGYLETFRPYAPPDAEWLRETARKINSR
jgi:S-DNA-T family DNA segregation ATPase FtsK/SpoIIIE